MRQVQLRDVEYLILMGIHYQTGINILEHLIPLIQSQEAITKNNVLCHAVPADHLDRLGVPVNHRLNGDFQHFRLVDQAVEGYDVLVSVLREELRKLVVDVQ